MDTPQNDYGRALSIDAEAIGRPGDRRFRILVRSTSSSASVWMEKQQLAGIGTWFEETLQRLDKEKQSNDPDVEPASINEPFDLEFHVSQVGLGYIEAEDVFALQLFDVAQAQRRRQTPTLRCFLSRGQSRVLSRKIARVIAGGRPICPLCEMPMEPEGHVCPRSNGHYANATI